MSEWKKAILINATIAITLAVESRFYRLEAIVLTAVILFPLANAAIAFKVLNKRPRGS